VLERRELALESSAASPSHHLRLTLAYLEGSGWTADAIHAAVRQSAQILGQCGVALEKVGLLQIGAPERFRAFYRPAARELSRALNLDKPTVYFVGGARQLPAFDAEAFGRGNTRSRPELRDTVWVAQGARDLDVVLAHEIAHVLMDSGEHSQEPGNLMRDETTPENTRLSDGQCARLRENGLAHGLLRLAR
jgi:hypothetical protein